jgi:hypothetical protein
MMGFAQAEQIGRPLHGGLYMNETPTIDRAFVDEGSTCISRLLCVTGFRAASVETLAMFTRDVARLHVSARHARQLSRSL